MRRYLLIIEKSDGKYWAYTPDMPGCAAAGESAEEAEKNLVAALRLHVEGLEKDKTPLPGLTH